MKSGKPFALAGIWENWKRPETEEWVRTFAIITTNSNELVSAIHDRMPVIMRTRGLHSLALTFGTRSTRPAGAVSSRAHDDVANLDSREQAGQ